jgi:hypothetical protein
MNAVMVRWDDTSLQNKPGQWKPTEQPYRVSTHIKFGPRFNDYRTIVRTFASEVEARAYMATVPAKFRPSLCVAVNAATWKQNGKWSVLSSPSGLPRATSSAPSNPTAPKE